MKKTPMKLESLTIERETWGENRGKYKGRVRFGSQNADIYLNITNEHSRKILEMCADALLDTAHEAAELMRDDIIEGLPYQEVKKVGAR